MSNGLCGFSGHPEHVKKVILILCAGTPKIKKVSIFLKKFAFTPLQNRNFRYNNHRPVRLCSSVGRAGD
jgi:hypothetical protein